MSLNFHRPQALLATHCQSATAMMATIRPRPPVNSQEGPPLLLSAGATRAITRFPPPGALRGSCRPVGVGLALPRPTALLQGERRPRIVLIQLQQPSSSAAVIAPCPTTQTMIGAGRIPMRPATGPSTTGLVAPKETGLSILGLARAFLARLALRAQLRKLRKTAAGGSGLNLLLVGPGQSLPLTGPHVTPARDGLGATTGPRGTLATVPTARLHPLPSGGPAGSMLMPRMPMGSGGPPRGSLAFELTRHPQEGNPTGAGHTTTIVRIVPGPGGIGAHPRGTGDGTPNPGGRMISGGRMTTGHPPPRSTHRPAGDRQLVGMPRTVELATAGDTRHLPADLPRDGTRNRPRADQWLLGMADMAALPRGSLARPRSPPPGEVGGLRRRPLARSPQGQLSPPPSRPSLSLLTPPSLRRPPPCNLPPAPLHLRPNPPWQRSAAGVGAAAAREVARLRRPLPPPLRMMTQLPRISESCSPTPSRPPRPAAPWLNVPARGVHGWWS